MRLFSLKAWSVIGLSRSSPRGRSSRRSSRQRRRRRLPPDGGPFTGSGPGGGARQDPGQNLMSNPVPDDRELADAQPRHEVGPGDQLPARPEGRHVGAPPDRAADRLLRRVGQDRPELRQQGMFVSGHGMCRDRDGNIWAGDSGPFGDVAGAAGPRLRGLQVQPRREAAADAWQAGRLARPGRTPSSARRRARSCPTGT